MMRMKSEQSEPSAAEWKVLSVVWEKGPLASRDIIKALSEESWSPSTIKTLLRRLDQKGLLKTKRVGNSFLYSTAQGPWKALRRAGEALMENAGEMAAKPLLMHLVKRGGLSAGDLAELRDLIDELSEEEGS